MQVNQQSKQAVFQFFKNMSAYLPMPIYWIDLEGIVQGANESGCKLFEFSSDVFVVGKTLFDLYPSQMATKIIKHNLEVIRTGQIFTQELAVVDEEGKRWNFNAMKIPLKDDAGEIIGIAVSPNTALLKTDYLPKDRQIVDKYVSALEGMNDFNFADLCVAESRITSYGCTAENYLTEFMPFELLHK